MCSAVSTTRPEATSPSSSTSRCSATNGAWTILGGDDRRIATSRRNESARSASDTRLLRDIEAWLGVDSHRRILVLLDEADRWLEADAAGEFSRVDKLKAAMDRTDRRFKVVFAGLHNVQRTTRAANNPLAHLGEPRCIGPLIEGSEWQFARELIERPLMALGYRFETPDLVVRILSQTNYYPVLLQLYGSRIIRRTTGPNAQHFDPRTSPPYRITPQLIDQVYQQAGLQLEIEASSPSHWIWTSATISSLC